MSCHPDVVQGLYSMVRSSNAAIFESNIHGRYAFKNGSGLVEDGLYGLRMVDDDETILHESIAMGFDFGAPPEPRVRLNLHHSLLQPTSLAHIQLTSTHRATFSLPSSHPHFHPTSTFSSSRHFHLPILIPTHLLLPLSLVSPPPPPPPLLQESIRLPR